MRMNPKPDLRPAESIAGLKKAVEKAWDNAPNKNGYEIYEEIKKAISEFEASVRERLKELEGELEKQESCERLRLPEIIAQTKELRRILGDGDSK